MFKLWKTCKETDQETFWPFFLGGLGRGGKKVEYSFGIWKLLKLLLVRQAARVQNGLFSDSSFNSLIRVDLSMHLGAHGSLSNG